MKNQIKDLTDSNILRGWLDSLPAQTTTSIKPVWLSLVPKAEAKY